MEDLIELEGSYVTVLMIKVIENKIKVNGIDRAMDESFHNEPKFIVKHSWSICRYMNTYL